MNGDPKLIKNLRSKLDDAIQIATEALNLLDGRSTGLCATVDLIDRLNRIERQEMPVINVEPGRKALGVKGFPAGHEERLNDWIRKQIEDDPTFQPLNVIVNPTANASLYVVFEYEVKS